MRYLTNCLILKIKGCDKMFLRIVQFNLSCLLRHFSQQVYLHVHTYKHIVSTVEPGILSLFDFLAFQLH